MQVRHATFDVPSITVGSVISRLSVRVVDNYSRLPFLTLVPMPHPLYKSSGTKEGDSSEEIRR